MALNTVTTGNTVLASDINQLVNVLQRSAGQTETGKYVLAGGSYTSGANVSVYIPSLSRNSTPASASFDTADLAPSNLGALTQDRLSANGFHLWANGSATAAVAQAAGNWTIQF